MTGKVWKSLAKGIVYESMHDLVTLDLCERDIIIL